MFKELDIIKLKKDYKNNKEKERWFISKTKDVWANISCSYIFCISIKVKVLVA